MDLLDYLNEQGGLLPEPLAAHLFRQVVDAVRADMGTCRNVRCERHSSDESCSGPPNFCKMRRKQNRSR